MRRQLEDYTAEELRRLPYDRLVKLRADAFSRHVAGMAVPPELTRWGQRMTKRFGATLKVWQNECGWIVALMIVLYGEDVTQWPPEFTESDIERADAWFQGRRVRSAAGGYAKGDKPLGVTYEDEDDASGSLVIFALTLLSGALAGGAGGGIAFGLAGVVAGVAVGLLLATALTNHWENELIDHLFRGRSYTAPTDHYFALYTAAPGEAGGGTEVSGGSYARVQVTADDSEFLGTGGETTATDSTGTGGATENRNAIVFPSPTADWGQVTHFAILDASSSGNMRTYGALTTPKTVNNGDPAPAFAAGAFVFTLA